MQRADKPKQIPVFDSTQVSRFIHKEYKFPEHMLNDIVFKVRPETRNNSLVTIMEDHLFKGNYPQLTDKEREYVKILLKDFGKAQYGECKLYFWW